MLSHTWRTAAADCCRMLSHTWRTAAACCLTRGGLLPHAVLHVVDCCRMLSHTWWTAAACCLTRGGLLPHAVLHVADCCRMLSHTLCTYRLVVPSRLTRGAWLPHAWRMSITLLRPHTWVCGQASHALCAAAARICWMNTLTRVRCTLGGYTDASEVSVEAYMAYADYEVRGRRVFTPTP